MVRVLGMVRTIGYYIVGYCHRSESTLRAEALVDQASIYHKRYILHEVLGQGGMGIVYHAEDRLLHSAVALKRVTAFANHIAAANTTPRHSSHSDRIVLAREFQTLASLRHPNIISVLEYGFEEGDPFFTMEYLRGGVPINQYPAQSPQEKVGLIIQILQALRYLHRRGLLHRDLKPANVLVVDGVVKLLDFGLTVTREQAVGTVGTVAYMAPETLREEPATEASDLYAVGLMAYELLSGRYPFDQSSTSNLLQQILNSPPDLSQLGDLPIDLVDAIASLLDKDRAQRCSRASDAIEMLRPFAIKEDVEAAREIQESYLQAARFVGRETEISLLKNGLLSSIDGRGSAWLIGGESGVGKSRLLNELRIIALVEGALVLQGSAVSEGGSPYQSWHDIIEMLVLSTDVTPEQASVIRDVVPNVRQLVDFPVPDAPALNPQATQDRFLNTVEALFKTIDKPVLVLLEDLHWAGSEVFILLNRLAKTSGKLALMLVGTYRDDEAPDLPTRIRSAQVVRLGRLESADVAVLLEGMLGTKGSEPRIVEFVQRETEGNTFFIVEAIRALAEESGELENIPSAALPTEILAGGMNAVIKRRLDRVPQGAQALLQIAAVVGRDIDLAVLQATDETAKLNEWLRACAGAAVLEAKGSGWHFAHAKLRDALLRSLPPDQVKTINAKVAEISERVHPDKPALLAHYWRMAGSRPREAVFTAAAGEQALANGAYQEAIRYLNRAAVVASSAQFDVTQRGRIQSQLAQAHYGLGHLLEAKHHISSALDLIGYPVGSSRNEIIIGLLRALVRQIMHRFVPSTIRRAGETQREILLEAARALQLFGEISYFTLEIPQGIFAVLQAMNLSETAGLSPELAQSAISMAIACGLVPMHKAAEFYAQLSQRTMDQLAQPAMNATVSNLVAIHYIGMGKWQNAEGALQRAAQYSGESGDIRQWTTAAATRAIMLDYKGHFEEAAGLNDLVYETALRSENIQQQGWGLYSRAENLLRLGRSEEALEHLDRAVLSLVDDVRLAAKVRVLPSRALSLMRLGRENDAREQAEEAAALVLANRPTVYSGLEGYSALAEVYLALWQAARMRGSADTDTLHQRARASCKLLFRYSRYFPVGIARAHLYNGQLKAAMDHRNAAIKAWTAGMPAARSFSNIYDEARLLAALGTTRRHRESVERAQSLFKQCGAAYDLSQLQSVDD
jgi:eukaryotic-like serine/threonine-protein kinase